MPLSQYILFFKPIGFFWFNLNVFLVDIEKISTYNSANLDTFYLVYHFWDIWLLRFKGLTLTFDFRPSEVIWGQKYGWYSRSYTRLPIWLLLTLALYLVPFSRYSTSNFQGFDLDFWILKVIWGQRILAIWKPIFDLLFNFYWYFRSILYRFRDIWHQSFYRLTLTFDL